MVDVGVQPVEPDPPRGRGPRSLPDQRFAIGLIVVQSVLIVLFGVFVRYYPADDSAHAHVDGYAYFQDVHIMIFIGFGFLMTFLKRYGYGAIGFNLLLAVVVIQWSVLCLLESTFAPFHLKFVHIVEGDIAAAAVLISFGAVIGRLNPCQLLVMTLLEVVFYSANFYIAANVFKLADPGGSIVVHTFGAYFGLAVSACHWRPWLAEQDRCAPSYVSNLFSMIGSVFLWICWPSFNACLLAHPANQYRAVLNTFFSLCSSTAFTFALTALFNARARLGMEFIQNATLAGGVAIGALADQAIGLWAAALIGAIAAALATVGFEWLTPMLNAHRLFDSCGVHNLHGMPGIVSAIASAVGVLLSSQAQYDGDQVLASADQSNYRHTFPAIRVLHSAHNSTLLGVSDTLVVDGERTPATQALYQIIALLVTLCFALAGGLLTGALLHVSVLFGPTADEERAFDDQTHWTLPDESDDVKLDRVQPAENEHARQRRSIEMRRIDIYKAE